MLPVMPFTEQYARESVPREAGLVGGALHRAGKKGPGDTARADTGHRPSGRPDGPRDLHGPGGSNVTAPTPITRG
jgi:hypothetical protein